MVVAKDQLQALVVDHTKTSHDDLLAKLGLLQLARVQYFDASDRAKVQVINHRGPSLVIFFLPESVKSLVNHVRFFRRGVDNLVEIIFVSTSNVGAHVEKAYRDLGACAFLHEANAEAIITEVKELLESPFVFRKKFKSPTSSSDSPASLTPSPDPTGGGLNLRPSDNVGSGSGEFSAPRAPSSEGSPAIKGRLTRRQTSSAAASKPEESAASKQETLPPPDILAEIELAREKKPDSRDSVGETHRPFAVTRMEETVDPGISSHSAASSAHHPQHAPGEPFYTAPETKNSPAVLYATIAAVILVIIVAIILLSGKGGDSDAILELTPIPTAAPLIIGGESASAPEEDDILNIGSIPQAQPYASPTRTVESLSQPAEPPVSTTPPPDSTESIRTALMSGQEMIGREVTIDGYVTHGSGAFAESQFFVKNGRHGIQVSDPNAVDFAAPLEGTKVVVTGELADENGNLVIYLTKTITINRNDQQGARELSTAVPITPMEIGEELESLLVTLDNLALDPSYTTGQPNEFFYRDNQGNVIPVAFHESTDIPLSPPARLTSLTGIIIERADSRTPYKYWIYPRNISDLR